VGTAVSVGSAVAATVAVVLAACPGAALQPDTIILTVRRTLKKRRLWFISFFVGFSFVSSKPPKGQVPLRVGIILPAHRMDFAWHIVPAGYPGLGTVSFANKLCNNPTAVLIFI
jgi:hypothetical protein